MERMVVDPDLRRRLAANAVLPTSPPTTAVGTPRSAASTTTCAIPRITDADGGGAGLFAVVTTEPLSADLAGPAIRTVELGRVPAAEHDVSRSPRPASCSEPGRSRLRTGTSVDTAALRAPRGTMRRHGPWRRCASRERVVGRREARQSSSTSYDPLHFSSNLEQARDLGEAEASARGLRRYRRPERAGRASRHASLRVMRQRDMWLGHLAACGRVNPATYDADPTLRTLLRVVPFGVADEPPPPGAPALRGVVRGIGVDDEILLWGGGIY